MKKTKENTAKNPIDSAGDKTKRKETLNTKTAITISYPHPLASGKKTKWKLCES
ncbi:MAG: hypothetical protein U9Q92_00405 [archaeon]|nr:hypothetical protein [archaeon]